MINRADAGLGFGSYLARFPSISRRTTLISYSRLHTVEELKVPDDFLISSSLLVLSDTFFLQLYPR